MEGKYRVFSEYKDSGEVWLGKIPGHWKPIQIKHLSAVKRGASPRPIDDPKYFDDQGEYAWTRIADVTSANVYLTIAPQRLSELGSSLSVKLEPGSLFLSIAGSVGKPCITGIKACIHDGFVYFPQLNIPGKFLFYVFSGEQAYKGLGKMGTQLNLNTDTVGGIKIGLTDFDELNNIVLFLDHETAKIDTLIEKQQQLIKLLKEKRQAVISHAVTKGLNPDAPMKPSGVEWLGDVPEHWVVGKCGFYIQVLTGFSFPSTKFITDVNATKLLRGINIGVSTIKWRELVYWQRTPYDNLDLYDMKVGDIALGMDRPLISEGIRVAKISKKDLPCLLVQRVASLKSSDRVHGDYLMGLLSSDMFVSHFSPDTTGVSVPHISPEQIKSFVIPIPSITEQKRIVSYLKTTVDKVECLIMTVNDAISLMQERRTALISAAVTGKIDVRNWHPPEPAETQKEGAA